MRGERPSVRFPSRTVPICVREPVGTAKPFRMAKTPAMKVVVTAPSPASRTPRRPFAGEISRGFCNDDHYNMHWSREAFIETSMSHNQSFLEKTHVVVQS